MFLSFFLSFDTISRVFGQGARGYLPAPESMVYGKTTMGTRYIFAWAVDQHHSASQSRVSLHYIVVSAHYLVLILRFNHCSSLTLISKDKQDETTQWNQNRTIRWLRKSPMNPPANGEGKREQSNQIPTSYLSLLCADEPCSCLSSRLYGRSQLGR